VALSTYVTVLFFEEARKNACFEKNASFFWGQGVPPCSPQGMVDSEGVGSILPICYENKALNTVVFFIYEIVKQFIEPRGFKEKSDIAIQCSKHW
jgi:hypothetical protein